MARFEPGWLLTRWRAGARIGFCAALGGGLGWLISALWPLPIGSSDRLIMLAGTMGAGIGACFGMRRVSEAGPGGTVSRSRRPQQNAFEKEWSLGASGRIIRIRGHPRDRRGSWFPGCEPGETDSAVAARANIRRSGQNLRDHLSPKVDPRGVVVRA